MPVEIIRSARRTVAVEVRPDGQIVVRAPRRMPKREIQRFLAEKSGWIEKHLAAVRQREEAERRDPQPKLTQEELKELAEEARRVIPRRCAHYADIIGVDFGRVTIRCQSSRWGSCSAKGNLNFNCLLLLCPPEVLDYVVVHELCHRLELNHSPRFWAEVARVLPDWAGRREWLKQNGERLIRRARPD